MQKSLFVKYFSVNSAITLFSIVFFGTMLLIFSTQHFEREKSALLANNVQTAISFTVNEYKRNDYKFVNSDAILNGYSILGDAIGANLFLCSTEGVVKLSTGNLPPLQVSRDIINKAISGRYVETGKLGGIYTTQYYTVGAPITLPDGTVAGVVFASSSASSLGVYINDMLVMIVISAGAVLLVSSLAIYFITYNMVKPLRQMSAAAKSFAKGDFSARIDVVSGDEIGELATAFNNMATSLSELENMRRSFIANVSHELKTPMTVIGGFVDGILDSTIPRKDQTHYLEIVSGEVKRLARLVKSMLNLARVQAGEMKLVPTTFDLTPIICDTFFHFEKAINDKKIEVKGLDMERISMVADEDLIHQVVYNLIENAVKFTQENGTIEVSTVSDADHITVSIKNTGEGISIDDIPYIFERFYKTDKSRGLDKNGVGLGLYIVKTIIDLHDGRITVKSQPGEFSEFIFSLPQKQITSKMKKLAKEQSNKTGTARGATQ